MSKITYRGHILATGLTNEVVEIAVAEFPMGKRVDGKNQAATILNWAILAGELGKEDAKRISEWFKQFSEGEDPGVSDSMKTSEDKPSFNDILRNMIEDVNQGTAPVSKEDAEMWKKNFQEWIDTHPEDEESV